MSSLAFVRAGLHRITVKSFLKLACPEVSPAFRTLATKIDDHTLRRKILEYRHIYPEFLPDPDVKFRNPIREKLERIDMVARRTQIDIPEFYVGSIMAVTSSDKHTPEKPHRFVGICIKRGGCGLRSYFILRNVVDHQGVEIMYEMYDPSLHKVEILRLEKRLDDELLYLRDALPDYIGVEIMYEMYDPSLHKVEILRLEKRLDDELLYLRDALPDYSTFDVNMEPEILAEGTAVPVNPIKVKLKPKPWLERWERKNLRGVQDLELPQKFYDRAKELEKPWEKYDLMKEYMRTIPEEEQLEIFGEVESELHKLELQRKKMKRKRVFVKPTKLS